MKNFKLFYPNSKYEFRNTMNEFVFVVKTKNEKQHYDETYD